jgi:hypothetical protein
MTDQAASNAAARREQILNAVRNVAVLEADRKDIGERIRTIKRMVIKDDLNMKIGDFNAALRLYALKGDDRAKFFDTLRETFAALGVGTQLDWISAAAEDQATFNSAEAEEDEFSVR